MAHLNDSPIAQFFEAENEIDICKWFRMRARKKGHIFTHPVKSGTLLNATFFAEAPFWNSVSQTMY